MTIREYLPSDTPSIINLMSEFAVYLESLDPLERTEFAEGGAEFFTAKMLDLAQNKQGKVFVAEEKGENIGFIGGHIAQQSDERALSF